MQFNQADCRMIKTHTIIKSIHFENRYNMHTNFSTYKVDKFNTY